MSVKDLDPADQPAGNIPVKPPLVLLNGWGLNREVWTPLMPLLEKDWEVHPLDLPGYAGLGNCDYQDLDQVVLDLLNRAPQTATWAGWSLGATLSLRAALLEPRRIRQLCLISPTPRYLKTQGWACGMERVQLEELWSVFQDSYANGLKRFLLLQTRDRTLLRSLQQLILQHPAPSPQVLRASLQLLIDTDLRESLADLEMPVQVVLGKQDQVVPPLASRLLAAQCSMGQESSESNLTELEGGHLCFLEEPAALGAVLEKLALTSPPTSPAANSAGTPAAKSKGFQD